MSEDKKIVKKTFRFRQKPYATPKTGSPEIIDLSKDSPQPNTSHTNFPLNTPGTPNLPSPILPVEKNNEAIPSSPLTPETMSPRVSPWWSSPGLWKPGDPEPSPLPPKEDTQKHRRNLQKEFHDDKYDTDSTICYTDSEESLDSLSSSSDNDVKSREQIKQKLETKYEKLLKKKIQMEDRMEMISKRIEQLGQ